MSLRQEQFEKRCEKNIEKLTNQDRAIKRDGKEGLEDSVREFKTYVGGTIDYICWMVREIPKMQVFPDVVPGYIRTKLRCKTISSRSVRSTFQNC